MMRRQTYTNKLCGIQFLPVNLWEACLEDTTFASFYQHRYGVFNIDVIDLKISETKPLIIVRVLRILKAF